MNRRTFFETLPPRVIPLTNMLSNSNFANGMTDWSDGGSGLGVMELATDPVKDNYSLKIKGGATYPDDGPVISYQLVTLVAGHHYYLAGWLRADGHLTLAGQLDMFMSNTEGTDEVVNVDYGPTLNANLNTWIRFSGKDDANMSGSHLARVYDFETTNYVYMDKLMLIDLTSDFGSGYEPSLSQMDALLLHQFTDGWFDGTQYARVPG